MTLNIKDLKQGDVIAIDWDGKQRIAIFNEFREPGINPTDTLHIYIELDPTVKEEGLIFKCKGYDFSYDLKSITYRKATCKEQRKLYDELCKYFAEEHDKDWYKHFSDDSYHDVLDYLLEAFNIEVDETLCTTSWYPSFVHEIQNYIWDKMCEFMGQSNETGFVEVGEELEDKMVSLDKVCDWLYNNWKGEDYYASDIIEGLHKAMEE